MKSKLFITSMSTIIGLYGVLFLFFLAIFMVLDATMELGFSIITLLLFSIGFLILQFLISPWITDLIMTFMYKADFNKEIPDYLEDFVKQVCIEHNMKYPKFAIIDDGAPNAFTYGRTKNDARIVLTRGIYDLLTPEEVKTVVAHEMGHAVHYDMLFMTIAQIVPLLLRLVVEVTLRRSSSRSKSKAEAVRFAIGIAAYILHVISQYVILWFSRTREYYADEFAVENTKDPNSLSKALVKIGYGLVTAGQTEDEGKKKAVLDISSVGAFGIFDSKTAKTLALTGCNEGAHQAERVKAAARWELWNPWAKYYELHSTHPLIAKRIDMISKKAGKYNQVPFVEFDETKPESYVNHFLTEVLICLLPTIIVLGTIAASIRYIARESDDVFLVISAGIVLFAFAYFIRLRRAYRNDEYKEYKIADLLGEVEVSNVTSIPCILRGTFIGRGSPGYIFSEDFVIRDDTGILFVDYNQPLSLMNFFFGLFKAKNYIDKEVVLHGWYKRAPIPYIELYHMHVDGRKKTCYTFGFKKFMAGVLLVFGILLSLIFLTGCGKAETHDIDAHKIPYPAGIVLDGAAGVERKFDVPDSPYFPVIDFYNKKSDGSLIILENFKTYQQTTEVTCGPACVIMVLEHYGLYDGFNYLNLYELRADKTRPESMLKDLMTMFESVGQWDFYSTYDLEDPSYVPKDLLLNALKEGKPIIIGDGEWGIGHWRIVIGYDDMDDEFDGNDVLILAESYDVTHHNQDGYMIMPFWRLYYNWTNQFDPDFSQNVFLIASPK